MFMSSVGVFEEPSVREPWDGIRARLGWSHGVGSFNSDVCRTSV